MTGSGTTRSAILIIDDVDQVRRLLKEVLCDHDCVLAASAEEALELLDSRTFDLVLSDINMPGISGLDLVPKILARAPDMVVVMVSGEQTIESAIEAMRVGAFDYITKPLDLRHVEAAVDRALAHHKLLVDRRIYSEHLAELVNERTAEIEHLAYHDKLTDLPNRSLFLQQCEMAVADCAENSTSGAVILVSIDRFKRITDTLGHAAGDMLISESAARLRQCFSEEKFLARYDTDEFILLLPRIENAETALDAASSITEAMKPPFVVADEQEVFLTASLGIALFPSDGGTASQILSNAGAALEVANKQVGNTVRLYTAEQNAQARRQLGLEMNLRHAVEANQFVNYYQPIVNLGTGKLVGCEALVRWQHPRLGLLAPADFIGLAEDTGLILDIGMWVINDACRQMRHWHRQGLGPLRIAVNVSGRQFHDQAFGGRLIEALAEAQLDPQSMELEITETTIIESLDAAIEILTALRKTGMKISIDDFGTGYSSLSYLKHLPIDTVKLDRSFVSGSSSDPRDAALVMAIVNLAHSLGLKVIAEGIETESQRDFLRLLKCDEGQGYLLGRPAPSEMFDWSAFDRTRKQNVVSTPAPPQVPLRAINE